MSACRFWWRAGEVSWCDMLGRACKCSGWDECCDLKLSQQKTHLTQAAHSTMKHVASRAQKKYRRAA